MNKVYGDYQGSLDNTEHLKKCTQLELFLLIKTIDSTIQFINDSFYRIKENDEDLYALCYAMCLTTRFGVQIKKGTDKEPIKITNSFRKWYRWCSEYVANNFLLEQINNTTSKIDIPFWPEKPFPTLKPYIAKDSPELKLSLF